uniref:Uncharacterized protein n=1 Tax=Romanomermis culicivorax TaxID=13658 RepID=A0A915I8Y6_ROMCU
MKYTENALLPLPSSLEHDAFNASQTGDLLRQRGDVVPTDNGSATETVTDEISALIEGNLVFSRGKRVEDVLTVAVTPSRQKCMGGRTSTLEERLVAIYSSWAHWFCCVRVHPFINDYCGNFASKTGTPHIIILLFIASLMSEKGRAHLDRWNYPRKTLSLTDVKHKKINPASPPFNRNVLSPVVAAATFGVDRLLSMAAAAAAAAAAIACCFNKNKYCAANICLNFSTSLLLWVCTQEDDDDDVVVAAAVVNKSGTVGNWTPIEPPEPKKGTDAKPLVKVVEQMPFLFSNKF